MHITFAILRGMAPEKVNLTTSEVARQARVAPSTVRRWVESGALKPSMVTPGGQYRFSQEAVNEILSPALRNGGAA